MNYTIKLFSILFLSILFITCSNNNQQKTQLTNLLEQEKLIEFNIENVANPVPLKLSELGVNYIEYIPLETNDSCLVSGISKLRTDGKNIVFYQSGGVMKFDLNGSFVARIGKIGRGPLEYQNAHDIQIEPTTGNIYILSGWEDKFYIYSPYGKFIKNVFVPESATNFAFNNGEILCFSSNVSGDVENSFHVIDYEGNIKKSFTNKFKYERGKLGMGFSNECFLFNLDDKLMVKEIFCDTVFEFVNDQFSPRFVINRGESRLPASSRTINSDEDFSRNINPYIFDYNILIMKDFIYSLCNYKGNIGYIFGNIENGETKIHFSYDGPINDIDGEFQIKPETKLTDDIAISWIDAFELKSHVFSDAFKNSTPKYPEKKKQLEQLANSLDENDNPVLILVKLKE